MEFKQLVKNRGLRKIIDWTFIITLAVLMILFRSLFFLVAGFGVFFLGRVIYQKWFLIRKRKIQSAENFIQEIYKNKKEYCLILRPFGNDSHFKFNNVNAETVIESLLFSTWREVTIEEAIQNIVKSHGIDIETVALVDPKLTFVPKSPKFISTPSNTWQWVVFDLLKRALWVFIIIPSKTKITDSLIWEMNKIMELGLAGRFAIILPPSSVSENKRLVNEIREKLFFISDQLDFIVDGTILIYPNEQSEGTFIFNNWDQLPANKKWNHLKTLPLSAYKDCLRMILKRMNDLTNIQSYEQRYIHQYREFLEDDYNLNLSREYLQSYLRVRPKH